MIQDLGLIEYIENLDEWWHWLCEPPPYQADHAWHTFEVTFDVRDGSHRFIYAWEWVT